MFVVWLGITFFLAPILTSWRHIFQWRHSKWFWDSLSVQDMQKCVGWKWKVLQSFLSQLFILWFVLKPSAFYSRNATLILSKKTETKLMSSLWWLSLLRRVRFLCKKEKETCARKTQNHHKITFFFLKTKCGHCLHLSNALPTTFEQDSGLRSRRSCFEQDFCFLKTGKHVLDFAQRGGFPKYPWRACSNRRWVRRQ